MSDFFNYELFQIELGLKLSENDDFLHFDFRPIFNRFLTDFGPKLSNFEKSRKSYVFEESIFSSKMFFFSHSATKNSCTLKIGNSNKN